MHDIRLALRSLRRNPALSALMVLVIAAGIAASMVAITTYHGRAGHPIWWKADKLYAVMLDNRDLDAGNGSSSLAHPEYPPFQVTYQDARELYRSDIPTRSVRTFRSNVVVKPERLGESPFAAAVRITSADFFSMFDVPFLYGSGWSRQDDDLPAPVIVLSRHANQKLFGDVNSVGRFITIGERQYRVTGVIDAWMPQPKFYDLSRGGFDVPEDIFIPFGWTEVLKLPSGANCVRRDTRITRFEDLLTGDCVWLQYWTELSSADQRERFQRFVDNYVTDQKRFGRFPRPLNNRIVDVDEWLKMWDVVGDETRMQVALAMVFLLVCVLNTFGLMLAKFLNSAPIGGLRRALGATRVDLIRQHLVEAVVVGILGGALGLAISFLALRALRLAMDMPLPGLGDNPARLAMQQSLTHMDWTMFSVALALSLFTGILAGLYPAWRISKLAPSTFLKSQ